MPKQQGSRMVFAVRGDATSSDIEIDIYDIVGDSWYGGVSASDVRNVLKSNKTAQTISLRVNSAGGDVFEGIAIYNQLVAHPARVTVQVDGLAASIASIIAMAGDEIVMPENAFMMIHDPWGVQIGGAEDMRSFADLLEKSRQNLASIYAARTGQKLDEVLADMEAETWMTGPEAKKKGYATKVVPAKQLAASAWKLDGMRNVPSLISEARATTVANGLDSPPSPQRVAIQLELGPGLRAAAQQQPNQTATEAPRETTMQLTAILAVLGLAATATESDAVGSITAIKNDRDASSAAKKEADARISAFESLTSKTGDEAIGIVKGWKESAETSAKELAALRAKQEQDEVDSLFAKAKAEGRVTPAEEESMRKSLAAKEITSGYLRGYLPTKAKVVNVVSEANPNAIREPAEPIAAGGTVTDGDGVLLHGGKAYEDFSPGELAAVRDQEGGEKLYKQLRANWASRGKPRSSKKAA